MSWLYPICLLFSQVRPWGQKAPSASRESTGRVRSLSGECFLNFPAENLLLIFYYHPIWRGVFRALRRDAGSPPGLFPEVLTGQGFGNPPGILLLCSLLRNFPHSSRIRRKQNTEKLPKASSFLSFFQGINWKHVTIFKIISQIN